MTRTPESHRYTASVYRSEAEARRVTQPGFAATLERWADDAARRASQAEAKAQPDLFTERNRT